MSLWLTLTNLAALASGIAAHVFVFRHGEWDTTTPKIFVFYASLLAGGLLASYISLTSPLGQLLPFILTPKTVLQAAACHFTGLYSSMLVYRAWLHRLSSYPGPFLARLTNFYITARSVKKLHLYEEVRKLHAQYGDYVRIGEHSWPNLMSWLGWTYC